MASPNPAGVLSSAAGTAVTLEQHVRALAAPAPMQSGPAAPAGFTWHGGLFTGLVVAALGLAYLYKRIL